jgi:hypothetical protein
MSIVSLFHQFKDHVDVSKIFQGGRVIASQLTDAHTAEAAHGQQSRGMDSWHLKNGVVKNIHPIPGFEGESIVVAELDDGTFSCLVRDDDGHVNVAGVLPAWPQGAQTKGTWAIADGVGGQLAVYRVTGVKTQVLRTDRGSSQSQGVLLPAVWSF